AEGAVNDGFAQSDTTLAWQAFVARRGAEAAAGRLVAALNGLADALAEVAERADALAALGHRVAELGERGAALLRESEAEVRWVERRGSGWFWHATPLDVAAPFERALQAHTGSWVFTSATLSVNGSLDYFAGRLGLDDATKHVFDSPFDYRNNSLLYLPASMPLPSDSDFDAAFAGQVLGLVEASQGGAFVLCTSFRSLHAVAGRLRQEGVGPLLVQGEQGRAALLGEFRDHGDAVLVGTGSFWEGVDVRGPALRLVIIDRLPFASPSDPVLAARVDAMRQRGEAPFPGYQVPQAVIALKQGVGRLIRDHADRGLLAICDPRLTGKGYGRIFLSSLPDLPITRSRDEAEAFLRAAVPA
ncbi:MAG: ATP-dependent DNA helicase, partial [Salinisphaeraceae bacterium]